MRQSGTSGHDRCSATRPVLSWLSLVGCALAGLFVLAPVAVSQARIVVLHGDRPSYTVAVALTSGWTARHGSTGAVLFAHHDKRGHATDRVMALPCPALSLVDPTGFLLARQQSGGWSGDGARVSARVFQSPADGALYVAMAGGGCLILRDSGQEPSGSASQAKLHRRIVLARAIRATLGRGLSRSLPAAQRVARSMVARAAEGLAHAAAVVLAGQSIEPTTETFVYRLTRGNFRWDTVTSADNTIHSVTQRYDKFSFDSQYHCTNRLTSHSTQHPGFLGELTPAAHPWHAHYSWPVQLDSGEVSISITTPWQSISTVIGKGGAFTSFKITNRAVPWAARPRRIIDVTSVQTPSGLPRIPGDSRGCDQWISQ